MVEFHLLVTKRKHWVPFLLSCSATKNHLLIQFGVGTIASVYVDELEAFYFPQLAETENPIQTPCFSRWYSATFQQRYAGGFK
jgi:hypothetical protein